MRSSKKWTYAIANEKLDLSEIWMNVLAFVPLGLYTGLLVPVGRYRGSGHGCYSWSDTPCCDHKLGNLITKALREIPGGLSQVYDSGVSLSECIF